MKVEFTDRDKGWNKLKGEVKKAGASYTEIGYPADAKESKKKYKKKYKGQKKQMTTLEVAIIQEFGTSDGRVPSRSFIRSYFDKDNERISKLGKNLYSNVISGETSTKIALGLLGEYVKSGIQKQIDDTYTPALAPSTIKARMKKVEKAHTKAEMIEIRKMPVSKAIHPLIDSGQMRSSITHKEIIKRG